MPNPLRLDAESFAEQAKTIILSRLDESRGRCPVMALSLSLGYLVRRYAPGRPVKDVRDEALKSLQSEKRIDIYEVSNHRAPARWVKLVRPRNGE